MTEIILYMLIMFAFIYKSEIVLGGAYEGLMLWFNTVLPLLLPFMLMSSMITDKIKKLPPDRQKSFAILITIFTGLFCGYPLGAKNTAEFVKNKTYNKKTGQLLLPLCNNCSPMFLSGYIILSILKKSISFTFALVLIYLPYIVYILISLILFFISKKRINQKSKYIIFQNIKDTSGFIPNTSIQNNIAQRDYIMQTMIQTAYVGFYIIICSIVSKFIMHFSTGCESFKTLSASVTEITGGTKLISESDLFGIRTKIALVLSLSSFGGFCAIMQTANVIKDSGLSIIKYIIIKTICAISTYGLVLSLI